MPLLDSDAAFTRALTSAAPAERGRVAAELAAVRARGAACCASAEQVRLANALVLALSRVAQVER